MMFLDLNDRDLVNHHPGCIIMEYSMVKLGARYCMIEGVEKMTMTNI